MSNEVKPDDEGDEESFFHSGSSNNEELDHSLDEHKDGEKRKKKDNTLAKVNPPAEPAPHHEPTPKPSEMKMCLATCKAFWINVFTNLMLFFLVSGYAIFGGFLFFALESKKTRVHWDYLENKRSEYVQKLYRITENNPNFEFNADNKWEDSANKILMAFQNFVESEEMIRLKSQTVEWNLMSSIVYCVTLITTIGYGNIAPVTDEGRVITIWYSIIGIPLTLLYLTSIGGVMADLFRFVYNKLASFIGRQTESKSYGDSSIRVPVSVTLAILVLYVTVGAIMFQVWEKRWDFITSAYFCFITLSTIGLGDFVFGLDESHQDPYKQLVSSLYLFLGLSVMSMAFNLLKDEIVAKYKWVIKNLTKIKPQVQKGNETETVSSI